MADTDRTTLQNQKIQFYLTGLLPNDKRSSIFIQKTAEKSGQVDDLYRMVAKQCANGNGVPPDCIRLLYTDEMLEYGKNKSFEDYGLNHLSTLTLVARLEGGIWPLEAIEEKKRDLVPLPGFITVTSLPNEPDMISFDNSTDNKRAKMPCSHIIGPSSMTSYCQSLLSEGKYKFYCPAVNIDADCNSCNREWEYFLVRHVACLTEDEMHEFEKRITDNYLKKATGMQKCPGCQRWSFRPQGIENCVRCPLCTASKGSGYDFCWACLREWNGSNSRGICGNGDCDGKDRRLRVLSNCPTKMINQCMECPSIRGCPKCGMLIEHKEACGHMSCTSCKHGFCFICLKEKKSENQWRCSPAGICRLAPRQTSLPGIV